MNSRKFRAMMIEHGDTVESLSRVIGIARSTMYRKIGGYGGADFTREEIATIKRHWSLTPEEVDEIFFAVKVP